MAQNLLDFSPQNPLRDLDWRWRRAGYLLAHNRPFSRRRDDPWVKKCLRFRRAQDLCDGRADLYELEARHRALYWAHELYSNRDDPRQRLHAHALEARLLADQDRRSIAGRLRLSVDVVDAYHECFFDIQPHLASTDYLQFKVLGDAVYRGLRERHYDLLWKLFALWGGPHVLDSLISTFVDPARPGAASSVGAFVDDTVKGGLSLKAMVASKSVEVNGFTAVQLIEQYLAMVAIEKKEGAGGGTASILTCLGQVLNGLPFAVGRKSGAELGRVAPDAPGVLALDASAVDPTGRELLLVGAGETIEADDRPLPPPPRRRAAPHADAEGA